MIFHPTKLTTVKYNITIAAKYSQNALSSEIYIYLVSGLIYFLKQTMNDIIYYYL